MNSTRPILDTPNIARSHAASRGEGANAADFPAAFSDALRAAGSANTPAVGADRSRHVVKPGETLYGIAKAHLAAAGQPATAGASMRFALQIAQANQIRNPDRIHAGQQLDLSPATAPNNARNDAVTSGTRSTALSDSANPRPLQALAWQHSIREANRQEDVGEHDCSAEDCLLPTPAMPAVGRIAADDALLDRDVHVEAARVSLAIYEQTTPAAPPKPPGELPDILYKGVAGKALDLIPLDASTRTGLQQANAVISNSIAGRSLAALTGVGGPILTIAGLLWGIFSAQKISAMQSEEK